MDKKNLCFLLIISFMLVILSSCSSKAKTQNTGYIKNMANVNVSEQKQEENINKINIVYTINTEASLKHMYKTIDEFNKSDAVDTIVKGNIVNVEYTYIGGCSYSILTVDVLNSYKGNNVKTIKVYEDGGYVKVKDMIDKLKGNSLSQEQIDKGVIDIRFFNTPHSQVGQQVILYLTKNSSPLPTDSYRIISSVYGKFVLDSIDGKYKRAPLDTADSTVSNYEQSILKVNMENKLKNIN